ncbi:hypothetical protein KEM56_004016 [Ascosphaera pollenicola]|nr:hypothetical protein KEM56_004016 [Ascosphaera pollenicola]
MKFSVVSLFGLAALATAAGNDTTAAPVPTHTLSATEKCINDCGSDICCKAKCVGVPCPDATMANDTNDCVAACPQKDAKQFAQCQEGCIHSHYWSGTASLPVKTESADASTTASSDSAATTTAASGSTATADSTATGTTLSASKTAAATKAESSSDATATGDDSAPTASSFALANAPLAASVFGAAGFVAALFAL